jgi:hypothetical protein
VQLVRVDRVPEVAQAAAERATDLWKALWPQDQQRNHQDEQQVGRLQDVADHRSRA